MKVLLETMFAVGIVVGLALGIVLLAAPFGWAVNMTAHYMRPIFDAWFTYWRVS